MSSVVSDMPNVKKCLSEVIDGLEEIKLTINQMIEAKKYTKYISMGFVIGGGLLSGMFLIITGSILPPLAVVTTMVVTAILSKVGLESLIYNREKYQLNNAKLAISNSMKKSDNLRYLDELKRCLAKLFKFEQSEYNGNNHELIKQINEIIDDINETILEL